MASVHCTTLLRHAIIMRTSCFDTDFVSQIKLTKPLADLRGGGARDVRPLGYNFFYFHAVFGKNLVKWEVGAPTWGLAPLIWEILDPPLLKLPLTHCFVWYRSKRYIFLTFCFGNSDFTWDNFHTLQLKEPRDISSLKCCIHGKSTGKSLPIWPFLVLYFHFSDHFS